MKQFGEPSRKRTYRVQGNRTDGKRPDGATLVPWRRGRYLAWDATAIHKCAASYIHLTASTTVGAAEQAAERKLAKYSALTATHEFFPVAIESLGPIDRTGQEFLQELGRRMTEATGDRRETSHLFQRLSFCTQRCMQWQSEALLISTMVTRTFNTELCIVS